MKKKYRLLGIILFTVLLTTLIAVNCLISKGIINPEKIAFKRELILTKDYIENNAKCCAWGDTSCLAVLGDQGKSQVNFYVFLDKDQLQQASAQILKKINKKIDPSLDETTLVNIIIPNGSNDIYVSGMFISSNKSTPTIEDNLGTEFQINTTSTEKELEKYVFEFYGRLSSFSDNYELIFNSDFHVDFS